MSSEVMWHYLEDVIDDIIDRRGVTPLKLGGDFTSSGHRVISAKLVKDGQIRLDADEPRFVDEAIYKKWMRTPLQSGDVILTSEAPLGEVAYLAEDVDWALGQRLFCIRPIADRLDGRFLYYVLQTEKVRADLHGRASGTTVQGIRQTELRRVRVPVPELSTQEAVSEVLGTLDDRITLLRETNATLEAIAQALFKSWFVDFDPVRAKMEGRVPAGMDEATAALFPDSFEETELGSVPKGWRAGCLADLSTLNPESWTAKNHPDIVAYIDLANAKANEIASVTEFAFDDAPSRARRVLRAGDTMVGTVRPGNRSFAFIHEPASNLTASTGFAILRPTMTANAEFVYLAATQDTSIEHLAHVADGGAYPAVRPEVVSSLQCIVPSALILQNFHIAAAPLLAKVAENQQQAQTLSTLRDALLPYLISGRLRILGIYDDGCEK